MILYLTRIQEAKEDRLNCLYRTITMCKDKLKEAKEDSISSLRRAITKCRRPPQYQDEVMDVEEINKRILGKMFIRYIDHEGVDEKPGLRHLIQACINFLQTKAEGFWKNASITIYDEDDKMYKIASGTRKHQFICRMKNGEPIIKNKTSVIEHKKPKANCTSSTETTHNSSQTMDIFVQTVMNFCRTLEACNAEQRSVANEVLKSFSTFVEETLLTFHIRVGSSDTKNVKQLLFQDLVDLSRHLQPEQHKNVSSYLTRLQEAKEDRLSCLFRTIVMCRGNLQVAEKEVLQKKMKEQEKIDLMDFLTMTTNIIQGVITSNLTDSNLKSLVEKMKEHRGTFSYQDEVMDVEEINKRNLGKMIVRFVGHEGVDEKPGLRRLLQACIDFLQTEAEGFWKNASITIYDEDENMYKIASGTRKHQFICRMKNREPLIKKKTSVLEHKKPKPNPKPLTETKHDPSLTERDYSCSIS